MNVEKQRQKLIVAECPFWNDLNKKDYLSLMVLRRTAVYSLELSYTQSTLISLVIKKTI